MGVKVGRAFLLDYLENGYGDVPVRQFWHSHLVRVIDIYSLEHHAFPE